MHPCRWHIWPDPFAGKFLFAEHPFDRPAYVFQAIALGTSAHEHFCGTEQDVLKKRKNPAWLQQRRVRLQDVADILGREIVERQAGNDQIELPVSAARHRAELLDRTFHEVTSIGNMLNSGFCSKALRR